METANKYYIPVPEDFRIGFEFEFNKSLGGDKWECRKIQREDFALSEDGLVPVNEYMEHIFNGSIRVPYLTKEQQALEGWEWILVSTKDPIRWMKKCNYSSHYNYSNKSIIIHNSDDRLVYNGSCLCINQFRLICKMVGI